MSHPLFEKHRVTLEGALDAIRTRAYWSAYSEMPSPNVYGESAADDGKRAFEAHLGRQFELGQPGRQGWLGGERSPPRVPRTLPAEDARRDPSPRRRARHRSA